MGQWIGSEVNRLLGHAHVANPRVTVLGVTFKEDVPDIRNSRVPEIVTELEAFGAEVQVADCRADPALVAEEYGLSLVAEADLAPADAVVLAVAHESYVRRGWDMVLPLLRGPSPVVADVRHLLPREKLPPHVQLWRL
jgi:UDP-N-acetyl-D-galactosamine dehydrogenase